LDAENRRFRVAAMAAAAKRKPIQHIAGHYGWIHNML
jgi:hypothetical protein